MPMPRMGAIVIVTVAVVPVTVTQAMVVVVAPSIVMGAVVVTIVVAVFVVASSVAPREAPQHDRECCDHRNRDMSPHTVPPNLPSRRW